MPRDRFCSLVAGATMDHDLAEWQPGLSGPPGHSSRRRGSPSLGRRGLAAGAGAAKWPGSGVAGARGGCGIHSRGTGCPALEASTRAVDTCCGHLAGRFLIGAPFGVAPRSALGEPDRRRTRQHPRCGLGCRGRQRAYGTWCAGPADRDAGLLGGRRPGPASWTCPTQSLLHSRRTSGGGGGGRRCLGWCATRRCAVGPAGGAFALRGCLGRRGGGLLLGGRARSVRRDR